MEKIISAAEAASKVKDGMTIMVGGFLGAGSPDTLLGLIEKNGTKNLTVICNDTSFPDRGLGRLVANKQIAKIIVSHIGTNPCTADQMNSGEMIVEFSPQGTLAERVRAGGAGLGGVLTPTGLGTMVAEGKQVINIDGKDFLLEKPIRADLALIYATTVDHSGNCVYMGTTQNFNPLMATAADMVIVEAEEIVEMGKLNPEQVKTPSIFIDYIVKA